MQKSSILLFIVVSLANVTTAFAEQGQPLPIPSDTQSQEGSVAEYSNHNFTNRLHEMLNESREDLKEINGKTKNRGSSNQNQVRETHAKEFYEKGLELAEDGKFGEARFYFKKAIRITERSEMTRRIKESEERLRIQENALKRVRHEQIDEQKQLEIQTDKVYQQAVSLYQKKKYEESKKLFVNLNKIIINYKSTQSYLKKIEEDLTEQEKLQNLEKQKAAELQAKQEFEAKKKLEEKIKHEELVKQKIAELRIKEDAEAKKKQEEKAKREELEKLRVAELQAQQELEAKKKQEEKVKREELEKLRVAELQAKQELEAKKKQEEKFKREELEKLRVAELQVQQEAETKKKQEEKAKREELEKLRVAELQAQQELEAKKKQEEKVKREELEKLRVAELQAKQELEAKKKLEEKAKHEELVKQKITELQHKQELEARRKQEGQIKYEEQKKLKVDELQQKEKLRKEKEAKEFIKKQVEIDYVIALDFYKHERFTEAKEKFENVNKVLQGYRSTDYYLRRIDEDILNQQKYEEKSKQKIIEPQTENQAQLKNKEELEKQRITELQHKQKSESKKKLEDLAKHEEQEKLKVSKLRRKQEVEAQEKQKFLENKSSEDNKTQRKQNNKQKQEELPKDNNATEQIIKQSQYRYREAIDLYKNKKFTEAKDKFESISKEFPSYKATHSYLKRIDKEIATQKRREQEHKRWVEIQKGKEELKQKIFVETKVEESKPNSSAVILSRPTKDQQILEAKLLADLAAQSSFLYNQISTLSDDRVTIVAKNKLGKVDSVLNNLKQQTERLLAKAQEEEKRLKDQVLREEEQMRLQKIHQSYDEGVAFLRVKNFEEARKKFFEVESSEPNFKSTRNYLLRIKTNEKKAQEEAMIEKTRFEEKSLQEEENQKIVNERFLEKQKHNEKNRIREEGLKKLEIVELEKHEKLASLQKELTEIVQRSTVINDNILKLIKDKDYSGAKSKFDELAKEMEGLKLVKGAISNLSSKEEISKLQSKEKLYQNKSILSKEAQSFKEKETKNRQEIIFNQGLELYKTKKYVEAKIIFSELMSQGYLQARGYLKRIDRLIEENEIKNKNDDEKERSIYLKGRRTQQRIKDKIDTKDHVYQKRLTEELEKQKRLLEEERQQDRRHVETLRFQEMDRKRLEMQRQRIEDKIKTNDEEYHFRKIQPTALEASDQKNSGKSILESKKIEDKIRQEARQEKEKFTQIESVKKPKEVITEKIDSKGLQISKEQKRKKEMENLRKEAEEKERSRLEKFRSEKERRQKDIEKLRVEAEQKEKNRLEKSHFEQENHQQDKKKINLEKSIKEKQIKLESERRAIRQQLDKGVESMYWEAVKLYKSGNFQAAAGRFSDVSELAPDYKNTHGYIQKSQERMNKSVIPNRTIMPHKSSKLMLPAREDQISKTLDLFDSNPK